MTDELDRGETVWVERLSHGIAQNDLQRIELSRSAGGTYYWKIVAGAGRLEDAVQRAIQADRDLKREYGDQ